MFARGQQIVENDEIRLSVVPEFGARIIELIDKRSGRNWLVPGELAGETGDDAVYGGKVAAGWDECFPTVGPCDGSHDGWARILRDHGDLWGRPWSTARHEGAITHEYRAPEYSFSRTLELEGRRLRASYEVINESGKALRYLWSQHCLLSVNADDTIALRDTSMMTTTTVVLQGQPAAIGEIAWPHAPDLGPSLAHVRPAEARFALKAYAAVDGWFAARVSGREGFIELAWHASATPFVGVWLDYGAWPPGSPVHQIAIEPTTAAADDLRSAVRRGEHRVLGPGTRAGWTIEIAVGHDAAH